MAGPLLPATPMPASRLTVEEVRTRTACEEFLALGSRTAQAVPLLADDVRAWFRGDHPHVDELSLLLVRDDDGVPVGRCVTHCSAELDSVLSASLGPGPFQLFGAVAAPSPAVLQTLLGAVENRALRAGATGLLGPMELLPNQQGGALTSGFAADAFFDSPWTPPELADGLRAAGFSPWHPASTWEVAMRDIPPARRRRPDPTELEAAGVRREPASRLRLRGRGGQVERLREALNDSFAQLPYFTPISRRQMARQTAGLELLMDPRLVVLLTDESGRIVSFALVVPDPAPMLRRSRGELGLRELPRLLGENRDAVLIVQGTRPDCQGEGLLSLVSRELFAELHDGGREHLRVTSIGEDNPGSSRVFAHAGGHPLHRLSFFHRRVGPGDGATLQGPQWWCQVAERAPSAHNTQPWVPQPEAAASALRLTVDPSCTLPVGDPTHRDLHLSLGAWVESFAVAAASEGQHVSLEEVTGVGPDIRIRLSWSPEDATRPAVGAAAATVQDVLDRRVHRGRLLPPGPLDLPEGFHILDALDADPLERRAGRHLAATPELAAELLDWLRLDPQDPRWHEDGLSAECLQLPRAVQSRPVQRLLTGLRPALPALLGRISPPLTSAGTGVPVVMSWPDRSPAGQVEAGRRLQSLWLRLHRQGLAVSPASEVIDCPATVGRLGVEHPVAYFRVGIPDDVPPRSARRSVQRHEAVLPVQSGLDAVIDPADSVHLPHHGGHHDPVP